jgi:hypothetical protein
MKVRWTSGNLKGLEEEVAQPTGESAIASGIAVRVDGPETEAVQGGAENAAVRTGKAKPKGRAKKVSKKKASKKG